MATDTALVDILSSFTAATETAIQGLPEVDFIKPPENGISLLDAKNEIFLSYLQGLALRNLNVIRSLNDGGSLEESQKLSDKITGKLVEHRVYLERGVRSLEQKIKYQVDKVVKAADDEDRARMQRQQSARANDARKDVNDESASNSEDDADEDSDVGDNPIRDDVEGTSYRPNAAAFGQVNSEASKHERQPSSRSDGVYHPPRISATAMPTTEQRASKEARPSRSRTLDEYISTELSSAPLVQPSIGSTITSGGRQNRDARQLAKEQERRDYEETNLIRLPKESKKERAKQKSKDGRAGFGGEEWKGIGNSVDRIGDLTGKKGKESALDRSRKRRAVEDGPRSDGIGNAFDVKKRRLEKKLRR